MKRDEFARRVGAYRARLYRTAYLYLGNEDDALEAVDEAVYQALRALKSLRETDYFETWLMRILINICKKELRRRHRFSSEGEIPEAAAEEQLEHLPLKEAVQHLPEELRSVIVLRFFADLTQAETARILDVPQGTVATRQRKALQLLRLELGEEVEA